jgi:hypothetical protein
MEITSSHFRGGSSKPGAEVTQVIRSMTKTRKLPNRAQFLKKMREYLTQSKARLIGELATQFRNERDCSRDDGLDSCDLAFAENERELTTCSPIESDLRSLRSTVPSRE